MPPTSTVHSIGKEATGISAFTPAIRTATTSSSDVRCSMPAIAADMPGTTSADMVFTTHVVTTIARQDAATSACWTAGTVVTIVALTIQVARRTTIMVAVAIPPHVLLSITTARSDIAIVATAEATTDVATLAATADVAAT